MKFNPNKKSIQRLWTFLDKISRRKSIDLEDKVNEIHNEVFSRTDCLSCANCCKNYSPIIKKRDLTRMSKHFRISEKQFYVKHLKTDSDGDFVFQLSPCPFLLVDNRCSIYEIRPDACRDYPHTDGTDFRKRIPLTKKNTAVCPAVFEIISKLEQELEGQF
ncbi:MAG TPA: YkgJ family cysteine cluster protein [Bacteroidia bacterium]|nr:YkgJ family cysteine cluster protein [Bacteroidia bacterium]